MLVLGTVFASCEKEINSPESGCNCGEVTDVNHILINDTINDIHKDYLNITIENDCSENLIISTTKYLPYKSEFVSPVIGQKICKETNW